MGVRDVRYWVVTKDLLHKAITHGPVNETQFNSYRQAEIYKIGLETLNPDKQYAIMRLVPEKYEQVSLFTGEQDTHEY